MSFLLPSASNSPVQKEKKMVWRSREQVTLALKKLQEDRTYLTSPSPFFPSVSSILLEN